VRCERAFASMLYDFLLAMLDFSIH
jgi:hypothetical protein